MMLHFAAFARPSGIDHDIRRRGRIVLHLDAEVIETCLLVVARDIGELVELAAVWFRQWNRDTAVGGTFEVVAAHGKGRSNSLTSLASRINLDRVGSLTGDNRSCRYRPVVNRIDVCRHATCVARAKG